MLCEEFLRYINFKDVVTFSVDIKYLVATVRIRGNFVIFQLDVHIIYSYIKCYTMDNIGVQSGKPTFIDEISQCVNKKTLFGRSVSVIGRLTAHEVSTCLAKLADSQSKSEICIDTSLIEPFEARFGSLFNMIGELEEGNQNEIVLKARVVRCVDGLDMSLYRKAIECQRKYLENRQLGI